MSDTNNRRPPRTPTQQLRNDVDVLATAIKSAVLDSMDDEITQVPELERSVTEVVDAGANLIRGFLHCCLHASVALQQIAANTKKDA